MSRADVAKLLCVFKLDIYQNFYPCFTNCIYLIMKSDPSLSLDVIERILFFITVSYFVSNFLWLFGLGFYFWFFSFAVTGATVAVLLDRLVVIPAGKAVLITGCDTGFGNATAKRLNELGYHVLAGCLFADQEPAQELKAAGIDVFPLDVTKDLDLSFLPAKLTARGTQLWAVITNAGLSTFGEVEWVPLDVCEKIMNVNYFGTVRTVRACLPYLRRSGGRVITVASMLGRFAASSRSSYAASKWAVEGFSECLRLEMRRWDVPVCVVEPGNFVAGTGLYQGGLVDKQMDYMWTKMDEEVKSVYGKEYFDKQGDLMKNYTSGGNTNIRPVVEGMVDAVSHTYPQTRYQIMTAEEKIKCFIATHLPSIIYDNLYY